MTQNQIAYLNAVETQRRNRASEQLEQQRRDIDRYSAETQRMKAESDISVNEMRNYLSQLEGRKAELANLLSEMYYTGDTDAVREFLGVDPQEGLFSDDIQMLLTMPRDIDLVGKTQKVGAALTGDKEWNPLNVFGNLLNMLFDPW